MKNKNHYETLYLKIVFEDDHDAYKKLFYEFYPSLCVFAGRYIAASETCEDIVQEVFFYMEKQKIFKHPFFLSKFFGYKCQK